ncbi:hypothetical protein SBA4_6700003 [Candidatus Sulfopaludibacter sp. SbA4]|nr:hypothetical protein SBA4_6700003 [Candidatus Sulfopaludibacter sp. SbA4]
MSQESPESWALASTHTREWHAASQSADSLPSPRDPLYVIVSTTVAAASPDWNTATDGLESAALGYFSHSGA